MSSADLPRRLAAEALGTALLVAAVVGSGIMGERLAGGNDAIALLGNTLATGAALPVLILVFGPISGAHFNPVVSASFALQRALPWNECAAYVPAQIAGAIVGTLLAHLMFGEPLLQASTHVRSGLGVWTGEIVATFALLLTIVGCQRSQPKAVPYAVGLVITAGYWFTSSTSFANPAVAIARSLTDTFAGIRPQDVPGFIAAEFVAAVAASILFRWLFAGTGMPMRAADGQIGRSAP
jgi:glycerol uptake facilitator-like aquaporin